MIELSLDAAVTELVETFTARQRNDRHASDAFFFLIGAGLSAPYVPLALEIEARCQAVLAGRGRDVGYLREKAPSASIDRYSFWLEQAFPQPIDRQEFFQDLIQRHPISPANFSLAHLLSNVLVPHLVVTTNFDDFLSRALTLFGTSHIVCDHPETAGRIDPERRGEVQILHVHGTYWFYDCCNLRGEIDRRASDTLAHRTIASRLQSVLDRRAPIVLGYSGWEDDIVMTALRERLAAPLAYNIYWFCHRREIPDAFPAWLQACENLRVIVPAEPTKREQDGSEVGRPRLDAGTVLDALIRALAMHAPELTVNPIAFLAQHLRKSLLPEEPPESTYPSTDTYLLEPMIERLEEMIDLWVPSTDKADDDSTPSRLERIRDAIRRSQYDHAIEELRQLDLRALDLASLMEVRDTASHAANRVGPLSAEQLAGYEISASASGLIHPDDEEAAQANAQALVETLTDIAWLRSHTDKPKAALEAIERALGIADDDPALREQTARALHRKGYALWQLDRLDESIEVYESIVRRFKTATDPRLRYEAASAMLEIEWMAKGRGDYQHAIALCDEVIRRYGDDTDPDLRWTTARALERKRESFEAMNDPEQVQASAQELIHRFSTSSDQFAQQQVAAARLALAQSEEDLGQTSSALERYRLLRVLHGDGKDYVHKRVGALAAVGEGRCLLELGERDAGLAVLEDAVDRYGEDPLMEEVAAEAQSLIEEAG